MKILKILLFVLLFIYGFQTFSNDNYYTNVKLDYYKNELFKTVKGKSYYDKFNLILKKYSDNMYVLKKLSDRIVELKDIVNSEGNIYSSDIKNLIYFMDLSVYFSLGGEDVSISEIQDDKKTNMDEENKEEIIYPGFSDNYLDINKNIVAGDDTIIFSGKTSSKYEAVEVGTITFYFDGVNAGELKNSLQYANLYLEGYNVARTTQSDVDIISSTKASLTFNNLNGFIVPQNSIKFRLGIKANSIGYEKIGKTIKELRINKVSLSDAVGLNSGNKINAFTTDISIEPFSIVPGVPIMSVLTDLNDSTYIKFNIKGEFGDNTIDTNNSTPSIELKKLIFIIYDNSNGTVYKLVNSDDSSDEVIGVKNGSLVEFDMSSMNIDNKTVGDGAGEDYKLLIESTNSLVSIEMPKNGIIYDVIGVDGAVDLNVNMFRFINFGNRDF